MSKSTNPITPAKEEAVIKKLQYRFGLSHPKRYKEIDRNVDWRTPIYWKKNGRYFVCAFSAGNPFLKILDIVIPQIKSEELLVRIFIAYLKPFFRSKGQAKTFEGYIKRSKNLGVGLISIGSSNAVSIEYLGVPVNLYKEKPSLNYYKKILHHPIQDAYDVYIGGDPAAGVQKLGQIVESAMKNLAIQAKNNDKLNNLDVTPHTYTAQSVIIDSLVSERIISVGLLGRCRGFCDDRGDVSHKQSTISQQIKIEKKLKQNWESGLRILEELPDEFHKKRYKFKI